NALCMSLLLSLDCIRDRLEGGALFITSGSSVVRLQPARLPQPQEVNAEAFHVSRDQLSAHQLGMRSNKKIWRRHGGTRPARDFRRAL
ncbi:MAG TPA: hypothetical protein VE486_04690, partial [Candidatus Baltobacteraceae bacterium]|nr:hypothetical protein [Candidatus Baltobacteraceae bacterium]